MPARSDHPMAAPIATIAPHAPTEASARRVRASRPVLGAVGSVMGVVAGVMRARGRAGVAPFPGIFAALFHLLLLDVSLHFLRDDEERSKPCVNADQKAYSGDVSVAAADLSIKPLA